MDRQLRVRTWDERLAAASGISAAAAHGRPLEAIVPSISGRALLERFHAVLNAGEIQVLAPTFHHYLVPCAPRTPSAHFQQMQQRVTLGPLREGPSVVGVMVTLEDVTDRLEAERELSEAMRSRDPGAREAAARRLASAEHLVSPEPLVRGLRDGHWSVRRASVEGLTRHADTEMLRSLVLSLRTEHKDFNVLSSALQLLAASHLDVTAPLIDLLTDADPDLRIQAALALGEQHNVEAVPALMGALDDDNPNVRFHAIEALGRLRAAEAADRLADIAAAGEFFLAFPAIDALTAINDGRVAPRLVPLLASAELRDPVADALGELGDLEVVAPLVDALNEGRSPGQIVRALARLHARFETRYGGGAVIADAVRRALSPAGAQRVLDAVTHASTEDLRAFVLALGWLRGAAIERALTRLLGRPEVRSEVIEAIVRQGADIVDRLIEQLASDEIDIRVAAVTALGRIGSRRAVPALLPLLDSHDRRLVIETAGTLGTLADPAAFEPLLRLVGHADASVRQAAIGSLNSLGHHDMSSRVRHMLDDPDPIVRESAVRIAGYFGYRECVESLMARCADEDERVRRAALEQLPLVDDPRAIDLLARALAGDGGRARAAAANALGSIDGTRATELLIQASHDDDPWVRYFAARSLGSRGEAAVATLAALAVEDSAMQVRMAAVESLGLIDSTHCAEVLLSLAAGAGDLACAAIRSLGGQSSSSAPAAVAEALRSGDAARRRAAVDALARRPATGAIELLEWAAAADSDDEVAAAAVEALARVAHGDGAAAARAVGALVGLCADPRRRGEVVPLLGRLPAERIPMLACGLEQQQPDVRRATVDALGRLRHPEASAAIRRALDDRDPSVREAAIIALDRLGARGLSRMFAQLARNDESRVVRRAAAAALGRHGEES